MSKSYLNEIEKEKYPKHDKILALADALDCNFDELVSIQLDKNLAPIGELMQKISLENFLWNFSESIKLTYQYCKRSSQKVNAFINTLIEIAQTYNFDKDHFYLSVLRSFQELYNNYFPEIEEKAIEFKKYGLTTISIQTLEDILKQESDYQIYYEDYEEQGQLKHLRSLYSADHKILSINQKLGEQQNYLSLQRKLDFNI